jgi:hypothetical protein
MTPLALTKDNSSTIGFVLDCLFAGAIDNLELHAWAEHVLSATDSCPPYIIDLSTFDEPLFHIHRIVGFVPSSGLSDDEHVALIGIAFVRGRDQFEPVPTKEQALAALHHHFSLVTRFRSVFPFIDFEYERST